MDSVYRSVAKGLFQAGGGEMHTFGLIEQPVQDELQILWTSAALPPFAFVAHPRVPKKLLAKIQKAFKEMGHDPRGSGLLTGINFKGIELTDDLDNNEMRKMNIKPVVTK